MTRGTTRYGSVVVARVGVADDRALRLADVIVQPTQPTVDVAIVVAVRTLQRFTGCTAVVVGLTAGGCYGVLVLRRVRRSATSTALRSSTCEYSSRA